MATASNSSGSSVRKRRVDSNKPETKSDDNGEDNGGDLGKDTETEKSLQALQTGTYWLTRIVLLRSVAFIYFVAFSVAYSQNKQLIGEHGLMPCKNYLNSVKRYVGGKIGMAAFAYTPSILWLLDWSDMDANLDAIALVGMALSAFVLVTGMANMVIMVTLWVLYHSLVNVGQLWYSFGWESQLLETGFLAIFLCPAWTLSQVPRGCPPSLICIWTFRWLIVRIMLGAGLIKIRGDKCWRDLTCMDYHYETQPVPNPMSYYMHRSPWWFHRFETLSNHLIELIFPFFTFLGRRMCMVNGAIQILFQVVLIVSGNLSFLNWLTIVPSLACFDDSSLSFLFHPRGGAKKAVLEIQNEEAAGRTPRPTKGMLMRRVVNISLGILIGCLSVPVVMNLLSSKQVMNTSFDPLRIVNTYGAFGSITKERTEVIFQGTLSQDPKDPEAVWEEYQFLCKPDLRAERVGDPHSRTSAVQRQRGPLPARPQPLQRQSDSQVGSRGTFQVQVQPAGQHQRSAGEVVAEETHRALLPSRGPGSTQGLLPVQELAPPAHTNKQELKPRPETTAPRGDQRTFGAETV
ncbi:lipase maturation factor 1 isoform X3 [Chaetodon auriga]|uniref:lipase maturation factor 1 isoform X3 n=1 Tax=Chaetodon auriga TaxID=39042 RepID=UPI0040329EEB